VLLKYSSELFKNLNIDFKTLNAYGTATTKKIFIKEAPSLTEVSKKTKIDVFKFFSPQDLMINFKILNGDLYVDPFDIIVKKYIVNIEGYLKFDESMKFILKLCIPKHEFRNNEVLDNLQDEAHARGQQINISDMVYIEVVIEGTLKKYKVKVELKDSFKSLNTVIGNDIKMELLKLKNKIEQDIKRDKRRKR